MKANKASYVIALLTVILWTGTLQAIFGQSQPATSSGWHYFGTPDSIPRPAPKAAVGETIRTTPLVRPARSVSALEYQMYELINRERLDPANAAETGGQAQALRWNATLAAAARQHSRDMLEQKFFAHVDREGRSPGTRVKEAGIAWQAVGENIAIYDKVSTAQAAFMNEPRFGHNHRSNILDPKYNEVGVGIVEAPDGRYYITQEFLETPRELRASF